MTSSITYFGIRHHGPGCASSLSKALDALAPDHIVIEGPTGSEDILNFVMAEQMQPPVALLSYCVDDPSLSIFHPFAVFSPEWQAMLYAKKSDIPVSFMDLPAAITLGQMKQRREEHEKREELLHHQASEESKPESETNGNAEEIPEKIAEENAHPHEANETTAQEDAQNHAADGVTDETHDDASTLTQPVPHDPLDWLAQAAGYSDGESWWNHMVEERGNGADLFEAINQAMAEVRANTPKRDAAYELRESQREAYMRLEIKKAQKQGAKRIAVICGAWHVPALKEVISQTDDQKIIKGLPKVKVQTTWVPWTYMHLSTDSGYAAGITAPGWYEYLWHASQDHDQQQHNHRSVGWYVRIARLLRKQDMDCSSAHLIEAARLADTLAAMRERPAPSLIELNEAALSVICNGNDAPMKLIERELMVGHNIGTVPLNVPTVPLQKDLHDQQRSLRLKAEALEKGIDLDLRNNNDLARSYLLHRLNLLDIQWGELSRTGQKSKGTFHEYWRLSWKPEYEVDIIVASRYGHSIESAASALCKEKAQNATHLAELTHLMDKVLLANLPEAVKIVTHELEERSVASADPIELLNALPALANIYRYGNVRQTDVGQVTHLFDSILQRAVIALPLAVANINLDAAESVRQTLLDADRAITLRGADEQTTAWRQALKLVANAQSSAALLRGTCCRLLLDSNTIDMEEANSQLSLNLSVGADAQGAAQWLDGFLNRNATILLHNDHLWSLIDAWLSSLQNEHFIAVLPLVRRTFSEFEAADRRDLSLKAKQPLGKGAHQVQSATSSQNSSQNWNSERVKKILPTLEILLGI